MSSPVCWRPCWSQLGFCIHLLISWRSGDSGSCFPFGGSRPGGVCTSWWWQKWERASSNMQGLLSLFSAVHCHLWLTLLVKAGHRMNPRVMKWTYIPRMETKWRERILLNSNSTHHTHVNIIKWSQYSFPLCLSIAFISLAATEIAGKPAKYEGKKKNLIETSSFANF